MADRLIENIDEILAQKEEFIIPENIREDVTIFGVTGTFKGSEDLQEQLDAQDKVISKLQEALKNKTSGGGNQWEPFTQDLKISHSNKTEKLADPTKVEHNAISCTVDGSNDWWYRTYFKFDDLNTLIEQISSYMITSVVLHLKITGGGDNWNDSVCICTTPIKDYNPETINWNNQPDFEISNVVEFNTKGLQANDWIALDLTSMIHKIISTGNNYGIMLKAKSEGSYRHNWSTPGKGAELENQPYLTITGSRLVNSVVEN